MTLSAVDRQQHMHSTAVVFTKTLLKVCNLSHFLPQLLPGIYQSPRRPRFISHVDHFELCFLHSSSYSFEQSECFLRNEHQSFINTRACHGPFVWAGPIGKLDGLGRAAPRLLKNRWAGPGGGASPGIFMGRAGLEI